MGVKNVDLFELPRTDTSVPLPQPIDGLVRISQKQTNWCWAACALMAYRQKLRPAMELCNILDLQFPGNNCCMREFGCNNTCNAVQIADVYTKIHLRSSQLTPVTNTASMAITIRNELAEKRPVEIYYNLDSIGAHVVLIVGITPKDQVPEQFLVFDPAKPTSSMSIESLQTLDNQGTWLLYWTGIQ